jgi:hypothetical protein
MHIVKVNLTALRIFPHLSSSASVLQVIDKDDAHLETKFFYLRSYDSCRRLPEPKHHFFLFNH